ncbi:hypothetical protein GGF50DRAFT_62285 [Schizophyllum commune]
MLNIGRPSARVLRAVRAQTSTGRRRAAVRTFSTRDIDEARREEARTKTSHEAVSGSLREPTIQKLYSLKGRTAIVTGGGRGLGVSIAGAYLEAGADVYCVDVLPTAASPEEWDRLSTLAKNSGLTLGYRQLDITKQAQVNEVFRDIAAETPSPIRVLMASAGSTPSPLVQHESNAIDYDEADVRRVIDVNTVGTFNSVQAAARLMQQHNLGGSIAMIASMSATIANRGLTCVPYNASKAALVQMARSLAMEWAPSIRVNTLSPGYIKTILTERLVQDNPHRLGRWEGDNPLGRMSLPWEYKGPAVFLASDASSFVNGFDLRCE